MNLTRKNNIPSAAHYNDNRGMAQTFTQGGAPSNFLLLRNEKQSAPFNSTGKKLNITQQQFSNRK
jgi:hypothetical protein